MADIRIIARLTESLEFASLQEHYEDAKEKEYADLARKLHNAPRNLDQLDLAEKRGFYKGIEAVLSTPQKLASEIHSPGR